MPGHKENRTARERDRRAECIAAFSSWANINRFGKPVMELFRAVLPLFAALAVGVLLITYVPWLSTGLLALGR